MARPPLSEHDLNTQFGPHPNYEPPGGWSKATERPPDKLVKTIEVPQSSPGIAVRKDGVFNTPMSRRSRLGGQGRASLSEMAGTGPAMTIHEAGVSTMRPITLPARS